VADDLSCDRIFSISMALAGLTSALQEKSILGFVFFGSQKFADFWTLMVSKNEVTKLFLAVLGYRLPWVVRSKPARAKGGS
jgi:hypothetical protein